ncbi:hypothetical protein [Variovorax sp. RCC_210]|uniref:hypothetical protein n=1 Tax=Variovorax sp. RCC_210 TaxID=3239217 RepID=UPI003525B5FB
MSPSNCLGDSSQGQRAGSCHRLATFSSSKMRLKRWRIGAIHSAGVAAMRAVALELLSITWRRSSRSDLNIDRYWWASSAWADCSTSAMERTSEPPRPSCRSWASCSRSPRRALASASACSRPSVCVSSWRVMVMRSSSSRLKRSMRRRLRVTLHARMADMPTMMSGADTVV